MGFERFKNLSTEEKENLEFEDFTVSEMKVIIEETMLSVENKKIAEMRFVKLWSVDKIAERLVFDKRTVYARINTIRKKMLKTIKILIN